MDRLQSETGEMVRRPGVRLVDIKPGALLYIWEY